MYSQFYLDKIISIEELDEEDTIDIEVDGNNLFLANDILTHNSGLGSSDVDMTNTSESIGAPAAADIMLAIIATEELLEMNQYMFKQLKNRFSDIEKFKRFVVGVDKSKMRLYDVEQSAQGDIIDDGIKPIMDSTPSGKLDIDFSSFK